MRADRGRALVVAAVLLSLPALTARPAAAQSLFGYAQGQYQRFEEILQTRDSTGALHERRRIREFLLQNYELRNQTMLRPDLQLQASLRLSDLSYANLPDASRTPQGLLRLNHRAFAVSASHRPTTTTTGFGQTGQAAPGDSGRRVVVTSRAQETMFTGALFPERGPRLDLMWLRQHRNSDVLGPGSDATNRSARVGYDRGPLRLYGMIGDLRRTPDAVVRVTTDQRTLSGGGNLTFSPVRTTSVALQYDVADTRTEVPGRPQVLARSQGASLNSSYRPNAVVDFDLNYILRNAYFFNRAKSTTTDHDAGLFLNVTPRRAVRLTFGGGARTARGAFGSALVQYLSALAAVDGRVRPGWYGTAAASRTLNWEPERGRFTSDAVRAGSRFRLARGLDADLNAQVAANGDTASRDQRWTSELNGRVTATPVRAFTVALFERVYRVGHSLGRASSRATSSQGDVRWKPGAGLEMVGSLSTTTAAEGSAPRVTTRMGTVRWVPISQWQLIANWSKSEQNRQSTFAEQLNGREIAGLRVTGALGRRLSLTTGATVADPGETRETRQYDGSLTMTFGR